MPQRGNRPIQTVSLSLYRFDRLAALAWAFWMMGAARLQLSRMSGLEFWKLCGSGTGEGFTPSLGSGVFAILCVWPDHRVARARVRTERIFRLYRARSAEHWTIYLAPVSARGAWSGVSPFVPASCERGGPLAALTRATLRPRHVFRFWKRTPAISRVIGGDPNVAFKIGIGEFPFLRQVTFSVWPNREAMAAFARAPGGPHAGAIRAVRDGNWFQEELYARFRILGDSGSWHGESPIAGLDLK